MSKNNKKTIKKLSKSKQIRIRKKEMKNNVMIRETNFNIEKRLFILTVGGVTRRAAEI